MAGDAEVDSEVYRELEATGAFEYMELKVDEVTALFLLCYWSAEQQQLTVCETTRRLSTAWSCRWRS